MIMKKKLIILLLLTSPLVLIAQQARTFPYLLPLTGTTKPIEIQEGASSNAPTGTDRYTPNGIVLTNPSVLSRSGFALYDLSFTSDFGLEVEFEYAMYGGGGSTGNLFGDGMSFFLYDANVPFRLGVSGSGLGYYYSNNPATPGYDPNVATAYGLNGAYLGIALDSYGWHKGRILTTNQVVEGVPFAFNEYNKLGADHITVRAGVYPINQKGFPVLFSTQTSNANENKIASVRLNPIDGSYTSSKTLPTSPFNLRTGQSANGTILFNKIRLVLTPQIGGGMKISIFAIVNNVETTIVENLDYKLQFTALNFDNTPYSFSTPLPKKLKLGFAASTGGATQIHLVKNVRINLPYAPVMKEDHAGMSGYSKLSNVGLTTTFDIYNNDLFYRGAIANNPTSGNDATFIDSNSFQFEDKDGKVLASGPKAKYVQPGVGIWEYDAVTRKVKVTLTEEKYADEQLISIYYSAKGLSTGGGPFSDEYYRSAPTRITAKFFITDFEVRVNPRFSVEFEE